jgi:ATP-dependent Clp protease ATP-binding subunit ClpX
LNLVRKNSGQNNFVLPVSAVDGPDKFLSDLVVQSYYPAHSENQAG